MNEGKTKVKVYDDPAKIQYYANIITELEGYRDNASTAIGNVSRETYRSLVENYAFVGSYYNTYKTHKDNWFDELSKMKTELDNGLKEINNGITEARKKKTYWENQWHWEYY